MKAWHIVHWYDSHENHESRKLAQPWWVAKPNKHDGFAYSRLTLEPDALALYGAWSAILEVASKGPQQTRGWLIRNGQAMGAEDLAAVTRLPKGGLERALKFFSGEAIGWLSQEDFPGDGNAGAHPGKPGQGPGQAAGAHPGKPGQGPGQSPDTDRQTDRQTDREVQEEGRAALGGKRPAPSLREQFAALQAQIKEMRGRYAELTAEERKELRKKERRLGLVQDAQAAGRAEVPTE